MKYIQSNSIIVACILLLASCSYQETSTDTSFVYPETTKVDHTDDYFGTEVSDPYRWLEDDMSEETAQWVKEENEVTFSYLDNIDFRESLKTRLNELLDYERISAPFVKGEYEYFYKNDGLQNHRILYRSIKDSGDEPTVFLDPNKFSDDGTVALRGVSFTKDGKTSAHLITEGGSDWRKVIVMNAETMKVLEDTLKNVKFSGVSWYKQEGFYYSSYDNPEDGNGSQLSTKTQHHKLYYHKLGTSQSYDVLVFGGEAQPNRYVGGFVTDDINYLVYTGAQNTSGNQLYVKDLNNPDSEAIQMQADYMARFSYVTNVGDDFYFLTNILPPPVFTRSTFSVSGITSTQLEGSSRFTEINL